MNNKDGKFQDIKPQEKRGGDFFAPKEGSPGTMNYEPRTSRLPRGIGWGIFALVLIFVAGTAVSYREASGRAREALARNAKQFAAGVEDLKNFDAKSAGEKFSEVGGGTDGLDEAVGGLKSLFGGAGNAFSGLRMVAAGGAAIAEELDFLQKNALDLFLNGGGETIIEHLRSARDALRVVNEEGKKISSAAESFGGFDRFAGVFYLPLSLEASRTLNFLDSLIAWLENPSGRRVLVLLQNPSEIRPAGGFLGSYADIYIKNGQLESASVHDVNEVDRVAGRKVIPPRPLRATSVSWRAADANWFFDFPESAEKVVEFFESSGLYGGKEKFDGVVAVSPKVMSDILAVTGEIDLPGRKLVLNKDNFLAELQRIVQAGQAARATYPKKVLEELVSAAISRIRGLNPADKSRILSLAGGWMKEKDLQFYFKDRALENFAKFYGADGGVYEPPSGFAGDYLAIVDANIDGGKSDLFIRQNVFLESQINLDGTVSDHLVIDRAHEGDKSEYWWYRETNQNYLQVFLPVSARLTNFVGGVDKKIVPRVDYAKSGYASDTLVSEIESSEETVFNYPAARAHKESGKTVFSTWSATRAGAKTQIVFDYRVRAGLEPRAGAVYRFVFEKQAGASRSYRFQINAPVGFRFAENGLPVFSYESASPPGRLVLDLTLEKI